MSEANNPPERPEAPTAEILTVVQRVLAETYQESLADLGYQAEKLHRFNWQKRALRDYLGALQAVQRQVLARPYQADPAAAALGLPDRVPALGVLSLADLEPS